MQVVMMMAAVAGLTSGATVKLPAGPQPMIEIKNQKFDPPVTILADGADVKGLRIYNSAGIIWKGGTIRSPGGQNAISRDNRGVDITQSQDLTFVGVLITDAKSGMVVDGASGLTVSHSTFTRLRSDGIDLAGADNVLVDGNIFENFQPVVAIGKRGSKGFVDGDHPDAVQMWADRNGKEVTDVVVRNNSIRGDMQGINTFGPWGKGHKRIIVENNRVRISYPPGISVWHCSNCKVRFNTVETIPGSRFRANSTFNGSTGLFCGNRVVDVPKNVGNVRC